jgi:hypothetical protein
MIRNAILAVLTLLACAACVPGPTYVGFTAGVEGAPPPPPAVVVEPPAIALAEGDVYVVTDPAVPYDMFRFGTTWYLYSGGYWYQADSYRGPFAVVDVRFVPREVVSVPPGHWKHHPHGGPPGLEKRERGREG